MSDERCPDCGIDYEGYTIEDRMRIRPLKEVADNTIVLINRIRGKKIRSKKIDRDPMPGRATNIRWSR